MNFVPTCDECLETPMTDADDDYDCVGDPPRYVRTNHRVCQACREADPCEQPGCEEYGAERLDFSDDYPAGDRRRGAFRLCADHAKQAQAGRADRAAREEI